MKAVLVILAILLAIGWWQNEKESAKQENRPTVVEQIVNRIVSDSTESEKALRHPESMSPEDRVRAIQWGKESGDGSKPFYVEQVVALERQLSARMEGGYTWGSESERRARAAIRALDKTIDRDDFLAVPSKFSEAKEALRLFEAGCRWRAGLRHPSMPHISSADREGFWNADRGWRFIAPNRSLEVARTCYHCQGGGREVVLATCDRCNGTGWVDAPLSGVTGFLDDVANVLQTVDDIKHKRRPHGGGGRRSDQVKCPGCNGSGRVETTQTCRNCGGQGWTR